MTPDALEEMKAALTGLEPADAISVALMLALCSKLTEQLLPDQRKDIMDAALTAFRNAVILEMCETLLIKIKGEMPTAEQVVLRVNYTGRKSAERCSEATKLFFNLAEMLKP